MSITKRILAISYVSIIVLLLPNLISFYFSDYIAKILKYFNLPFPIHLLAIISFFVIIGLIFGHIVKKNSIESVFSSIIFGFIIFVLMLIILSPSIDPVIRKQIILGNEYEEAVPALGVFGFVLAISIANTFFIMIFLMSSAITHSKLNRKMQ